MLECTRYKLESQTGPTIPSVNFKVIKVPLERRNAVMMPLELFLLVLSEKERILIKSIIIWFTVFVD